MQSRYSFLRELSFQNAQTQGRSMFARPRANFPFICGNKTNGTDSLDRKRRRLRFQIHANDRGDAAMNGRQEHSSRGRQCGQRMSSSSHLHNCSSHCIDVRLVEQLTRAGVNVPVCKYGTGDPNRNASLPYRIEIKSNSHSKFKHRMDRAKA